MNSSTTRSTSSAPADADLAEQARPGHGIPSQDPSAAAQIALDPDESEREGKSVMAGGGAVGGVAIGAAIGVAMAGPVGVVVGGTLGAVAGALGAAAAGSMMHAGADTAPEAGASGAARATGSAVAPARPAARPRQHTARR